MPSKLVLLLSLSLSIGLPGLREATLGAAPQPQSALQQLIARAQSSGRIRVIVGHRSGSQAVVSGITTGSIQHVRTFERLPYFVADVDAASLSELAASPLVASIGEDIPRPMALSQSAPLVEGTLAWEAGFSGAGWTVAILDSGVDAAHPFLSGKVISEACFSTTDDSGRTTSTSLCPGGLATAAGSGSATPCQPVVANCDHGTHVAGIAAGAGSSFSGIARDADLVSIQVFSKFGAADCGGAECLLAWDSDVLAALDWVYSQRDVVQIAAVNLSLGGSLYSSPCDAAAPSMTAAINQLRQAGIATVIAAGNGGSTTGLSFPACISSAVSVGSTTKADVVSAFSNTSSFLSLLAPGETISSSVPGGGFASRMGTSMAAPHVAGAWAVLKQRKPDAGVDEILKALRADGRPITDSRAGSGVSFPRLQVKAALDALAVSEPLMALDTPSDGATPLPITVAGWAADRGAASGVGVDAVHVWAFPADGGPAVFAGAAALGERRDDVAAVIGSRFAMAGYRASVDGLEPGSYALVVFARSTVDGTFNQTRSVDVTVASSWPVMSLDGPGNPSTVSQPFAIGGWAADRAAPGGTGVDAVHVWAYPVGGGDPIFIGAASYGGVRPDVGNVLGRQFDSSAYSLEVTTLPAGTYDLVVFAHSSVAGTFNQARVARVTIKSST